MMKKLLKLSGLMIYTIIFGETFLRIMAPQPLMPRYVTGSADGVRANIPNVTYHHKTPEVDVEIRINAQGIRADREFSLEKPEDTYRIVLLGDSFFMGYEVELENSLAWLLDEKLRGRGVNAEVINLAVSGFGTSENLIALKERGLRYDPDLVIMEWHATDPSDNIRSNLFRLNDDQLETVSPAYLPGISKRDALMRIPGYPWLVGNSHLYSSVREKAATAVKGLLLALNRSPAKETEAADSSPAVADVLDETLIKAVQREAESVGAEFVLLDVPIRQSRVAYKSALSALELEELHNVNLVSPLDKLMQESSPEKKLYFEQGHGHWTVEGNRIVTDVLADALFSKVESVANLAARKNHSKLPL
ncbi:hypothetical protein P9J64_00765 [Deltaproteobacteria bacterium IMCC39524]|nr:hypothetical protein [Deltaproteobacteria bacterium IMCC39524]